MGLGGQKASGSRTARGLYATFQKSLQKEHQPPFCLCSYFSWLSFCDWNHSLYFFIPIEFIVLEKTCFHPSGVFGTASDLHFYQSLKVHEPYK